MQARTDEKACNRAVKPAGSRAASPFQAHDAPFQAHDTPFMAYDAPSREPARPFRGSATLFVSGNLPRLEGTSVYRAYRMLSEHAPHVFPSRSELTRQVGPIRPPSGGRKSRAVPKAKKNSNWNTCAGAQLQYSLLGIRGRYLCRIESSHSEPIRTSAALPGSGTACRARWPSRACVARVGCRVSQNR